MLDPEGVKHENEFWKGFVKTQRFADWCDTSRVTPELDERVALFLLGFNPGCIFNPGYILDVGSGPVSILNGLFPTKIDHMLNDVNITTADPLANQYKELVNYEALGIKPCFDYAAEELPEEWSDRFDVVHCSNALDHTVDPKKAFDNLLRCVRPGGMLIIQGHANEATHEGGAGFHKHNLWMENNNLYSKAYAPSHLSSSQPKLLDTPIILLNHPLDVSPYYTSQRKNSNNRYWYVWIGCK